MKKDTKAQGCPQCNEKTLYVEKRNAKYSRYRCINKNCNYTKTLQPHISKNKISNLNNILNLLKMCADKTKYANIEQLNFEQEVFLTKENIREFKIIHKDCPDAFVEHSSIILFCVNDELRYVTLYDYNSHFVSRSENVIRCTKDEGRNEKGNKNKKSDSKDKNNCKKDFEEFLKQNPDFFKAN